VAKGFAGAEDQTHASILSVRKLLSAPVEKPEGRTKHIAPTETGPPLYLILQTWSKYVLPRRRAHLLFADGRFGD